MPVLSLSTCWNSHRHEDGYKMLQEAAGLGFKYVELSHGVRISLVPGILKALAEGIVQVSSCHNFCPLPVGVVHAAPNLFEPSANNQKERMQWVRHTQRSIDFAAQTGARVLVCHLGHIEYLFFDPLRKVRRYLRGQVPMADDPAWPRLRDQGLARLRKRREASWRRMLGCVQQVLAYAAQRHVVLGFENRERLDEMPLDNDFAELFAALPEGAPVGYWHDAGHAAIKAALGVIDHERQLETNASRQVGWHLHDVDTQLADHLPLGAGCTDFSRLRRFWRPEHVFVLELHPGTDPEAVRQSRERLEGWLPA